MFQPTNDQKQIVMLAAAMGYGQDRIARMIINPENGRPISQKTLRKHFPTELEHGRDLILMKISGTMVSIATDKKHKGCVTAGIWLQKTWGRMREPEPEWSQRKREAEEAEEDAETGDIEIIAELVLEEPKPPALPAPTTIQ